MTLDYKTFSKGNQPMMRTMIFRFLLYSVSVVFAAEAVVKPGFLVKITPKGLQFLGDQGRSELIKEITKLTIPDQSGSENIHVGHVQYSFTNMHVTEFSFPNATISTKNNVGVTVAGTGLQISIHGGWKYSIHSIVPVKDHGSFEATISSISLSVTIEIGVDKSGRPTVHSSPSDCKFHTGDVKVDLHGGASWLYNLFDHTIEHAIRDSLNDKVCNIVLKEVNTDLAKEVATLKVLAPITANAEIDYSLVSAPEFNQSLTAAMKGEVYEIGNHTEAPYHIPTIPEDVEKSRMVFMWVTDFLANSAGYVLHNTNFFHYNVTQDKIPPGSKFSLNTSDFAVKFLIPELSERYPNMLMQLNLNTTVPPRLIILPEGVTALINGSIAAYVIHPNTTLTYVFTLASDLKLSALFGFSQTNLTWNSTFLSENVTLTSSAIGPFNLDILRMGLQLACKTYLIPMLNEMGADGIPLPTIGSYGFQNPTIIQGKGFLKIGLDLSSKPQAQRPSSNFFRG